MAVAGIEGAAQHFLIDALKGGLACVMLDIPPFVAERGERSPLGAEPFLQASGAPVYSSFPEARGGADELGGCARKIVSS